MANFLRVKFFIISFLAGLTHLLHAQTLPVEVVTELERAQIPLDAVAVVVQKMEGGEQLIQHRADALMNPASVMKLITTFAALDVLGSGWHWKTPVWVTEKPHFTLEENGVLRGNIYIKGVGDPSLGVEQVRQLLRRLRELGVQQIVGDIVLDQSSFAEPASTAADFDGEFLRPYNVQARALMLNQRSVTYTFTPRPDKGVAEVAVEPQLLGVRVDAQVPLHDGACQDWRDSLKADFLQQGKVTFKGKYSVRCGAQNWTVAYPYPQAYDAKLIQSIWQQEGGGLTGVVKEGKAPSGKPTFEWESSTLAEAVKAINTFSNNTMAQQLFLSLPRANPAAESEPTDEHKAGIWLYDWLKSYGRKAYLPAPLIQLENGSGLSRQQQISAGTLAALLHSAWTHREKEVFIDSLAKLGMPGTLRNFPLKTNFAQLKTGSLRDVAALAGYVSNEAGKRWVVVVMVNHPRAAMARSAWVRLLESLK
jgi:D-alanyl-D-alanine carboxypeptidase/D-alanyl-D-alanine-endopeptidase (penicillin-binding protein 4)